MSDITQWIARIDAFTSDLTGYVHQDPTFNAAQFTRWFPTSGYSTLKNYVNVKMTLISGATEECGLAIPDATPQPLPAKYVEWYHSPTEGLTESHHGPCEIYCGNTRVFKNDDCSTHYKTIPAQFPYDRASCLGASHLTFYWLTLHEYQWQVYINCVPLVATSAPANTSSTTVATGGLVASTVTSATTTTAVVSPTPATTATATAIVSTPLVTVATAPAVVTTTPVATAPVSTAVSTAPAASTTTVERPAAPSVTTATTTTTTASATAVAGDATADISSDIVTWDQIAALLRTFGLTAPPDATVQAVNNLRQ